ARDRSHAGSAAIRGTPGHGNSLRHVRLHRTHRKRDRKGAGEPSATRAGTRGAGFHELCKRVVALQLRCARSAPLRHADSLISPAPGTACASPPPPPCGTTAERLTCAFHVS